MKLVIRCTNLSTNEIMLVAGRIRCTGFDYEIGKHVFQFVDDGGEPLADDGETVDEAISEAHWPWPVRQRGWGPNIRREIAELSGCVAHQA